MDFDKDSAISSDTGIYLNLNLDLNINFDMERYQWLLRNAHESKRAQIFKTPPSISHIRLSEGAQTA